MTRAEQDSVAPGFLDVHTTRLFPRYQGAEKYAITGIAARCDWVFLSDYHAPQTYLHRNVQTDTPRHVFLSLRGPFDALSGFATQVLPRLTAPFVLVSGSEDLTLPRQEDHRWRGFSEEEQGHIRTILEHPMLIRWFAENLVEDSDPRFAPLPVGMVFPEGPPENGVPVPRHIPLGERPLRVLCAHRVREGEQWDLRRDVTELARSAWAPWCTVVEDELSEEGFLDLVRSHAFVICARGGGVDPSPKAWQTILHGSVPIICDSPLRSAYVELPVAFVPQWIAGSFSPPLLTAWRQRHVPAHDTPEGRRETLRRLGAAYWWDRIAACARR